MKKKSQYAFEFLIVFAFLTLLFMLWLNSYLDMAEGIRTTGRDNIIQKYGETFADRLYLAAQVTPGYSDEIKVISNIQGVDLEEVYIEKGSLVIRAYEDNYYFDIPCLFVVNNCYLSGKLDIKDKTVEMKNEYFKVTININDPACSPKCTILSDGSPSNCVELC